ncbi:MAG TPA: DUF86 domain-containing protein [bacterium]|nr:DUF86 domain-containing protein [bacterium]HPN44397.1 DUF86 domain-containing protein [bacterium]
MTRDDAVYLRHILDAIKRILEYLQNIDETEFKRNFLLQDGVIRQLEIIGEAAKQISQQTRNIYSNIPWKDMAGMRDKLIHDYFGLDLDQVWLTTQIDIPLLQEQIQQIIASLE